MIRAERAGDDLAIAALVTEAFETAPNRSGTEAEIVERLREAGALTLSLISEQDGRIAGHIGISPVTIDGEDCGWFGLGPVAVLPEYQGQGIGGRLIEAGLDQLRGAGAHGIVLLGDPAYYRRFGFNSEARLILPGVPPEYFQALGLGGEEAEGQVAYHPAFSC